MWKIILGSLLCLLGVLVGAYVGIYLCFIGGIVQVVTTVKATELLAWPLAVGITKILLASFVGWTSAFVFIIPGLTIFGFGADEL